MCHIFKKNCQAFVKIALCLLKKIGFFILKSWSRVMWYFYIAIILNILLSKWYRTRVKCKTKWNLIKYFFVSNEIIKIWLQNSRLLLARHSTGLHFETKKLLLTWTTVWKYSGRRHRKRESFIWQIILALFKTIFTPIVEEMFYIWNEQLYNFIISWAVCLFLVLNRKSESFHYVNCHRLNFEKYCCPNSENSDGFFQ